MADFHDRASAPTSFSKHHSFASPGLPATDATLADFVFWANLPLKTTVFCHSEGRHMHITTSPHPDDIADLRLSLESSAIFNQQRIYHQCKCCSKILLGLSIGSLAAAFLSWRWSPTGWSKRLVSNGLIRNKPIPTGKRAHNNHRGAAGRSQGSHSLINLGHAPGEAERCQSIRTNQM